MIAAEPLKMHEIISFKEFLSGFGYHELNLQSPHSSIKSQLMNAALILQFSNFRFPSFHFAYNNYQLPFILQPIIKIFLNTY